MARLNTSVHVYDELGRPTVYLPGDEVDPQHLAQITAPGVWEVEPGPVDDASETDGDGGTPDQGSSSENDDTTGEASDAPPADQSDASATAEALVIPPKGGPEATREAWTEYAHKAIAAAGLQIDIPADTKRADIIEALNGAGIPTE